MGQPLTQFNQQASYGKAVERRTQQYTQESTSIVDLQPFNYRSLELDVSKPYGNSESETRTAEFRIHCTEFLGF